MRRSIQCLYFSKGLLVAQQEATARFLSGLKKNLDHKLPIQSGGSVCAEGIVPEDWRPVFRSHAPNEVCVYVDSDGKEWARGQFCSQPYAVDVS